MAFIECSFYSKTLRIQTAVNVVIPEKCEHPEPYPVVWLFHGMFDNHTSWARNAPVERYAEDYGFAVVMPDAQRSYYTDMNQGGVYWQYISDELITTARKFFPLSQKREENIAAGLSMGGFGSFKLALTRPELVCAAGSFSGVLNIPARLKMDRGYHDEFLRIFGPPEEVPGSINDLIHHLSTCTDIDSLPKLYQCCGTEDVFLENNRSFKKAADDAGIPVTYMEDEGFDHQWDYWDICLRKFFSWARDVMQKS